MAVHTVTVKTEMYVGNYSALHAVNVETRRCVECNEHVQDIIALGGIKMGAVVATPQSPAVLSL